VVPPWLSFGLWKSAVGPEQNDTVSKSTRSHISQDTCTSEEDSQSFLDDDMHDFTVHKKEEEESSSFNDKKLLATPQQWIDHYKVQLHQTKEWTEVANLHYKMGNLYVQSHNYDAATKSFEQEAQTLIQQGITGEALVPIYKSLAKLWQVRQPQKALKYYHNALCCTKNPEEIQAIRHATGRLYFQTGNLERAMQVSLGQM
jgi:tetratricopeptide (TPR) repeat protein